MSTTAHRDALFSELVRDLMGPGEAAEILVDRPSDRYLTGILWPRRAPLPDEENERLDSAAGEDEELDNNTAEEAVSLNSTMRPSSMGLSFVARSPGYPGLQVSVSAARYEAREAAPEKQEGNGEAQRQTRRRPPFAWHRIGLSARVPVQVTGPQMRVNLAPYGLDGLELFVRWIKANTGDLLTIALLNVHEVTPEDGRTKAEEKNWFQVGLQIEPDEGTALIPRPPVLDAHDEDGRVAALIYRDREDFASGHTCAADWETASPGRAAKVFSTWIPSCRVQGISSAGDKVFIALGANTPVMSAGWLATAGRAELRTALLDFCAAYESWIAAERDRIPGLAAKFTEQAGKHVTQCSVGLERMRAGVDRLDQDADALLAFQLANRAMVKQRLWANPDDKDLVWRPFQLGFLLLALSSLADGNDPHRGTMDLLWFPTGGGKTEAYLGLTAFTLIHRRLRNKAPDTGAGVGVFMRYTLRLLTIQQFQRAATLVSALEWLRASKTLDASVRKRLGSIPFSIGLWVGGGAVPNTVDAAADALQTPSGATPAQLRNCPACRSRLRWRAITSPRSIRAFCEAKDCELSAISTALPVWTVSEDVYREVPSLIIGTADKFTQIVRDVQTGVIFGRGTSFDAPDLIIQDELHLISGPLGTLAALYETAIDELCRRGSVRPKIIGSTATIRQAADQVRCLFNRSTYQFPAPGIDADNSGFAVTDTASPGRLYVGITTAGRSAKFTLQAIAASLLQGVARLPKDGCDPYWTLVAYFNSLRELGGALVLMQDDVPMSLRDYAQRRGEQPRDLRNVRELTSRVPSSEIPQILDELSTPVDSPDPVDVLLATNMISVGVDVPRLGEMVVNGQPKAMAEYIQATSRVGRGKTPGLVITAYNNGKARDRSHYESFRSWHQALYREVEATSVTPFAGRARDRALHAVLVALVRHTIPAMATTPRLADPDSAEIQALIDAVVTRASSVDLEERDAVRAALRDLVARWAGRGALRDYWNDRARNRSLLISAEEAAALRASGRREGDAWPTPNSLRSVEPSTRFQLRERF
jgi:hypothetical protein